MTVKIKRVTDDGRQVPRGAVIFGLIFCGIGLVYAGLLSLWGLGLLHVAAGLAAFLRLRCARWLTASASCIVLAVFWYEQVKALGSSEAVFFGQKNLTDMLITTVFYLGVLLYFIRFYARARR